MSILGGLSVMIKLALRNLWRNLRRTFLTVATISFGLSVLLWVESILEGRNRNIIEKITSSYTGHVQVYDSRYLKDHQLQYTMKQTPDGLKDLEKQGVVLTSRVQLPALISSGENSTTILFQGIEPTSEANITDLRQFVTSGAYLEDTPDCQKKQILLGQGLAEFLGVEIGDKIVMMTQTAEGSLGSEAFHVHGLYQSKSPDFDKHYVFGTIACVGSLAGLRGPHEIVLRIPDEKQSLNFQSALAQLVGPSYQVTTWREAMPSMAAMIKFNHATFALLTVILFTVISLGVINTMLMSVFERTREFGVMLALGATPRQVAIVVTFESLFIGIASAIFATILGMIVLMYHSKVGFDLTPFLGESHSVEQFHLDVYIYPVIQFHSYLRSVAVTVLVVVLASLYPAFRASRLNPVECLRHT